MLTLNQIRELLKDRITSVVASAIKCHPETIRRIKRGGGATPLVIKALSDYLTGGTNAQ